MLKDADFMLRMLEDGDWVSRDTIVAWSQQIRGYGLTVHSRAADLRKRGHIIETRQQRNALGRVDSFYRLVTLNEEAEVAKTDGESVSRVLPPLPGLASASSLSVPAPNLAADGNAATVSTHAPASRDEAGTLELFACEIDESAAMRGAYGDAA